MGRYVGLLASGEGGSLDRAQGRYVGLLASGVMVIDNMCITCVVIKFSWIWQIICNLLRYEICCFFRLFYLQLIQSRLNLVAWDLADVQGLKLKTVNCWFHTI